MEDGRWKQKRQSLTVPQECLRLCRAVPSVVLILDFGLTPPAPPQDEDFHDLIADRWEG